MGWDGIFHGGGRFVGMAGWIDKKKEEKMDRMIYWDKKILMESIPKIGFGGCTVDKGIFGGVGRKIQRVIWT